jgi:hypothetical protein
MYNEIQRLKELTRKAKTQKERDAIDAQLKELSVKNPEQFAAGFEKSLQDSINEYRINTVKEQLKDVSEFISLSYIAKNYFNKSRTWIYQRINNHEVNGRPVYFTQQEVNTLNFALEDISHKIGSLKISL